MREFSNSVFTFNNDGTWSVLIHLGRYIMSVQTDSEHPTADSAVRAAGAKEAFLYGMPWSDELADFVVKYVEAALESARSGSAQNTTA